MNIQIKNTKINLTFSQETLCFKTDIYVDGKKAGTAENDGQGGSTNIRFDDRELQKKAEEYCKSLPALKSEYGELKMDLELFIDELVDDVANAKEKAKFAAKIKKDMLKGIVFGTEDDYKIFSWKNHTIESLLRHPKGPEAIKNAIVKINLELKPGQRILNTNIDQFLR